MAHSVFFRISALGSHFLFHVDFVDKEEAGMALSTVPFGNLVLGGCLYFHVACLCGVKGVFVVVDLVGILFLHDREFLVDYLGEVFSIGRYIHFHFAGIKNPCTLFHAGIEGYCTYFLFGSQVIPIHKIGIPTNWKNEPLWR